MIITIIIFSLMLLIYLQQKKQVGTKSLELCFLLAFSFKIRSKGSSLYGYILTCIAYIFLCTSQVCYAILYAQTKQKMKFRAVEVRISTKSYKYVCSNVYNLRKNNFCLYIISHKKEALSSEVSKVNHSVMNTLMNVPL